jgi:hypothetical protein
MEIRVHKPATNATYKVKPTAPPCAYCEKYPCGMMVVLTPIFQVMGYPEPDEYTLEIEASKNIINCFKGEILLWQFDLNASHNQRTDFFDVKSRDAYSKDQITAVEKAVLIINELQTTKGFMQSLEDHCVRFKP